MNDLKSRAKFVMTYLLTLVDGSQHLLQPVDPEGSILEMPENSDTWIGRLFNGPLIEIPNGLLMAVEPDRYRVSVSTNQGHKSFNLSEDEVNKSLENAPRDQETGEVKTTWSQIRDRQTGETLDLT